MQETYNLRLNIEWRNFSKVIDKAKEACKGGENATSEHFVDVNKTSPMPNGGKKQIGDIQLSRYACYLIVPNGDPRKKVIALGQTYFAVKTRQQELIENFESLEEDQKRLAIRHEMKEHNKLLVAAAKDAGVETSLEYAAFQNYGYMGLYGGLKALNYAEIMFKAKKMPIKHILTLVKKCARPLLSLAVLCPKICLPQKKV